MKHHRKWYSIGFPTIFGLSIFIRLILSLSPGLGMDMRYWLSLSSRMADVGPAGFYSTETWTSYTPGFLYWLWIGGKLGWTHQMMVKLPVLAADVFAGWLIWSILKNKNKKIAMSAFLLYIFNPALTFIGSVWGQIDGILACFLLLSVYFLVEKKSPFFAAFFWALALLIRPQALSIIFPLLIITINNHKLKDLVIAILIAITTIILGALPFLPSDPIFGFLKLLIKMSLLTPFTSISACNIWTLFAMGKSAVITFIGIPYSWWGVILFLISFVAIYKKYSHSLKYKSNIYLLFALSVFSFFLFPTGIHERYLLPAFAFLLLGASLSGSKELFIPYIASAFLHFFNVTFSYSYYSEIFLKSDLFQQFFQPLMPFISVVFIAIFIGIIFQDKLVKYNVLNRLDALFKSGENKEGLLFPEVKFPENRYKLLLISVLVISFLSKIILVWQPPGDLFDEVYYAFNARQILKGDPWAWEMGHPAPEGKNYSLAHPPIGNLLIAGGMVIFGENELGWRFPAALFGFGCAVLVYLLGTALFKDELLGILSAAIFSLDGLVFVLSRIALLEIFVLFFSLLAIYFLFKEKDLLSALAVGLALASKWSALWTIPILGLLWLYQKNKFRPGILWFILLPPVVYLASYLPMFFSGQDLAYFWEVQRTNWFFHTALKATHVYASPWWSWPLMIRPMHWYYQSPKAGWVAQIYSLGNPFVFWTGLITISVTLWITLIKKEKSAIIVLFSYFINFVPWAITGRTMYIYNYLPSIPFMTISTGYILRKYPRLILPVFVLIGLSFIYFYPHISGLAVPTWLDNTYYWFPTWR